MFNCATLTLFIMVTCIFITKCQKKEWMSERDRGPDSTAVHWNEKCCRQERAGLTNTDSTDPTYRPWRFSFLSFFFKIHLFHIFLKCSTQSAVFFPHTDPAWTDLSYSELVGSERRGSYTGAAKPGALNCLKLSNHNLAPWAAGPSLQARASLQTYRVAF